MNITLPFPPSLNRYYRTFKGRILIAADGRRYRTDVELVVLLAKVETFGESAVGVEIEAWMPDARKRDVDNLLKGVLDGMTHAGIWQDDSQIDYLSIRRMGIDRERPRLDITVTACN